MKQINTTILSGSMMIAGVTIGAGMLALPIISSGMWFFWSLVLLLVTWFLTYLSAKAILEVNLTYKAGTTLASMVQDILGTKWNIVTIVSILFVLYIILYAYISGGTSTIVQIAKSTYALELPPHVVSILFTAFFACIVFIRGSVLNKISSLMFVGLVIAFVLALGGLSSNFTFSNFILPENTKTFPYIWVALATYTTSFCFHTSVASLVKNFNGNTKVIQRSILFGSLIAFFCYLLWIAVIYGVIPRDAFRTILAEGGNIGELIKATQNGVNNTLILQCLAIFAFLALTTSFLGVGLGLFDYIIDLFKIPNSPKGRILAALLTFLPPVVAYLIRSDGFLLAISWAGLFVMVWSLFIPAYMLIQFRKLNKNTQFTCYKGNFWSYVIIVYALLTAVCHVLSLFGYLPSLQ